MENNDNKIKIDDFIDNIAKKTEFSDAKTKEFVHSLFDKIGESIDKENSVHIYKFGSFKKK